MKKNVATVVGFSCVLAIVSPVWAQPEPLSPQPEGEAATVPAPISVSTEPPIASTPLSPTVSAAVAADPNTATLQLRRGLTFDAGLGLGLLAGKEVSDPGYAVSLGLGFWATRKLTITFRTAVRVSLLDPDNDDDYFDRNALASFAFTGHYLVSPKIWVGGGPALVTAQGPLKGDKTGGILSNALVGLWFRAGYQVAQIRQHSFQLTLDTLIAGAPGQKTGLGVFTSLQYQLL
jgi:hypothetical protein